MEKAPMVNALCIDLEHWHSNEFLLDYLPAIKEDQAVAAVAPLLELLERYNCKATFCVLGSVAERHPELVKDISARGHEIASHGYSHQPLYKLNRQQFEHEIKDSVKLLESITGCKPVGFRAPSFSLDNSTRWALEVLINHGFKYDASIFPIKTMLYGLPRAPLHIYRPSLDDLTVEDKNGPIIEFPMTVLKAWRNIPVAGGFYLRALPLWFLRLAIRRVNRARPAIIYIHPWETYPGTPRIKGLPLLSRFEAYHGINTALRKFEALLREFRFDRIDRVIERTLDRENES